MVTENTTQSDGSTSFLRASRAGNLDRVLEHLKNNIDINTSNANGLNALHLASKDGHVHVASELLRRGALVDSATKKGNTALHIASLAGQEEIVKLLLQHNASVNVQSQNGFTPLYMAAQENHDTVVKLLLANGANQSLATEDGFTPLAVAMQQGHDKVVAVLLESDTRGKVRLPALHIAAKKDDVKAATLLLDNDHNPDVTSKSGFTPLHIASHYGNQSIANLLIQKGADVNFSAKHNISPLHVAAKWGKTNMVSLLLEKGANIEAKTRDGLTPLHCAARSGHEQVVDMLLERGAPISAKTKNGLAALHMAAQGEHVDAARILLYHRAPVDEVTIDYLTALHVAAHCGHVRVAKLLLDRNADANSRALNGFTPLHIACKKNRIKVVELLLRHGASIGATTESGLTPLHVAAFMGCMNIVIYLLQHDASPDVPTVRGETPLHLAARANQTDIIRILLRNGAQVDARAREQQTPLHIASRLGNVDIVMLLLQHGAQVDAITKDMYTALHISAKEGQDEVAAVLIDNGASLEATTKKGFTSLHLAAKYGHAKVAQLLLQKEADVDAQGKNGVTPLHVACHYDKQNVALMLLDKGASPHAIAKNGHTPLHIAARKNQMDIATTLLEYGAQSNAESKAGFTPLHLSSQEGHIELSNLLIDHKASVNHPAKNGLTPMHLCAQEDNVDMAEILLRNGANIDMATKAGYTPLHIACHFGQANMARYLLQHGANVNAATAIGYTPLHQAAQQGHCHIVKLLLERNANANALTANGQTPLNIAQRLGYISVLDSLKSVTNVDEMSQVSLEQKYRVVAPEAMHESFMSDSEDEGGDDNILPEQPYRYLTVDEMKSLGDDSLPIDVTRDERIDSNRMAQSTDFSIATQQILEGTTTSPYKPLTSMKSVLSGNFKTDNDHDDKRYVSRKLTWKSFLVSFLVDARGGAMRGRRHSGVRMIIPSRSTCQPTRITCRYVKPQRTMHPPQLMEGEALTSRILELGPVATKFLTPVIIEVPHFASLRGKEREIIILRSDNGETWREHIVENSEELIHDILHQCFEPEEIAQLEQQGNNHVCRFVTYDFPQYFAIVSRIRQEVHAIGPEGGMVSSTVVPQVQAVFPQGALTKKIKVGLQAQPVDPDLTAKLLGRGVAVSPIVTVEPRRRKFHKAITLSMPAPKAHSQGMINQYSGSTPTLRLLCSITGVFRKRSLKGGPSRAQWEDVTGSTPLTFVNDCVSFTTTVSARFWLMDCRNISEATKMATELYKEIIHVPFIAKFVVFAKRVESYEARLRVFCMTDDHEDKTLEKLECFTEVAKSRDVEVLEGKSQYIEMAGNLVPITKSGEQLSLPFKAFRENRLPFTVRVKDQHADIVGRILFMKEPKVVKGEAPQQPICILNIVLPEKIVPDSMTAFSEKIPPPFGIGYGNFSRHQNDHYIGDIRIVDLSNLLGKDWMKLAVELQINSEEIDEIIHQNSDSIARQAQSMIRLYKDKPNYDIGILEAALKNIGRDDIMNKCKSRHLSHSQEFYDTNRTKSMESVEKYIHEQNNEMRQLNESEEIKYSAEEKDVGESESDDESVKRTVAERREKIVKRLSMERQIPASSQKRELTREIIEIKRKSLIEDKKAMHESEIYMQMPADNSVKTSSILPDQVIKMKIGKTDLNQLHKNGAEKELLDKLKQSKVQTGTTIELSEDNMMVDVKDVADAKKIAEEINETKKELMTTLENINKDKQGTTEVTHKTTIVVNKIIRDIDDDLHSRKTVTKLVESLPEDSSCIKDKIRLFSQQEVETIKGSATDKKKISPPSKTETDQIVSERDRESSESLKAIEILGSEKQKNHDDDIPVAPEEKGPIERDRREPLTEKIVRQEDEDESEFDLKKESSVGEFKTLIDTADSSLQQIIDVGSAEEGPIILQELEVPPLKKESVELSEEIESADSQSRSSLIALDKELISDQTKTKTIVESSTVIKLSDYIPSLDTKVEKPLDESKEEDLEVFKTPIGDTSKSLQEESAIKEEEKITAVKESPVSEEFSEIREEIRRKDHETIEVQKVISKSVEAVRILRQEEKLTLEDLKSQLDGASGVQSVRTETRMSDMRTPTSPGIQIKESTIIASAPVLKESVIMETTPMLKESTTIETAPLLKESTIIERAPVLKESVIMETTPMLKESTTIETAPLLKESTTIETSPVLKESVTIETGPVLKETITMESAPVVKDSVIVETAPVLKESTIIERTPVLKESVTIETAPVLKESITMESATVVKESVMVETAPVLKESTIIERAPLLKESVIDETGPVLKESIIMESAPVVKESVIDETGPVLKESITMESAPVVKESVIVETAPVLKESTIIERTPVLKESVTIETAPVLKESIRMESAPVVKESVIDETGPVLKESIIMESAPVVKESVIVETAPLLKESTIIERAPVLKESITIETAPLLKESTIIERAPVLKESVIVETAPALKESTIIERAPLLKESVTIETAPVLKESIRMESAPVVKESVIVETAPVLKESTIIERAPLLKESVIVETSPVLKESIIMESAPMLKESTTIETGPVLKESIIIERAPVLKESVIVETAPALKESTIIERAPLLKEYVIVETGPVLKDSIIMESAPVLKESVIVETGPMLKESIIIESASALEEKEESTESTSIDISDKSKELEFTESPIEDTKTTESQEKVTISQFGEFKTFTTETKVVSKVIHKTQTVIVESPSTVKEEYIKIMEDSEPVDETTSFSKRIEITELPSTLDGDTTEKRVITRTFIETTPIVQEIVQIIKEGKESTQATVREDTESQEDSEYEVEKRILQSTESKASIDHLEPIEKEASMALTLYKETAGTQSPIEGSESSLTKLAISESDTKSNGQKGEKILIESDQQLLPLDNEEGASRESLSEEAPSTSKTHIEQPIISRPKERSAALMEEVRNEAEILIDHILHDTLDIISEKQQIETGTRGPEVVPSAATLESEVREEPEQSDIIERHQEIDDEEKDGVHNKHIDLEGVNDSTENGILPTPKPRSLKTGSPTNHSITHDESPISESPVPKPRSQIKPMISYTNLTALDEGTDQSDVPEVSEALDIDELELKDYPQKTSFYIGEPSQIITSSETIQQDSEGLDKSSSIVNLSAVISKEEQLKSEVALRESEEPEEDEPLVILEQDDLDKDIISGWIEETKPNRVPSIEEPLISLGKESFTEKMKMQPERESSKSPIVVEEDGLVEKLKSKTLEETKRFECEFDDAVKERVKSPEGTDISYKLDSINPDLDTSSSSSSQYKSLDKSASRPISSDFMTQMNSSEYQTAIDKEATEFLSAMSTSEKTISSHDSIRSFDSHSDISINSVSIDVSELSETLVESTMEETEEMTDPFEVSAKDDGKNIWNISENRMGSPLTLLRRSPEMTFKTKSEQKKITIQEESLPIPDELEEFNGDTKYSAVAIDDKKEELTQREGDTEMAPVESDERQGIPIPVNQVKDSNVSKVGPDEVKYASSLSEGSVRSLSMSSTSNVETVIDNIENPLLESIDTSSFAGFTGSLLQSDESEHIQPVPDEVQSEIGIDDDEDDDYNSYETEYSHQFRSPNDVLKKKKTITKTIEKAVEEKELPISPQLKSDTTESKDSIVKESAEVPIDIPTVKESERVEGVEGVEGILKERITYKSQDPGTSKKLMEEEESFQRIVQQEYKEKLAKLGDPDLKDFGTDDRKGTDSPDSFEMVEQPDISDEFIIIEEVAKEANEDELGGKSIRIKQTKYEAKHDEEVEKIIIKSAPADPKLGSQIYKDEMNFEFEESPPTGAGEESSNGDSKEEDNNSKEDALSLNRRWVEMQLTDNQLRYPYELTGAVLEDIKEEDAEFDVGSSRINSFKDSFSSTPECEAMAAQRYHPRGERDDISMSSLQEFESLEQAISLENRARNYQGSTDSSSGSFTRRYITRHTNNSGGHGDDVISLSSLKEFEGLENACIEAHLIEIKAKEEAALLSRSDDLNSTDSNEDASNSKSLLPVEQKTKSEEKESPLKATEQSVNSHLATFTTSTTNGIESTVTAISSLKDSPSSDEKKTSQQEEPQTSDVSLKDAPNTVPKKTDAK